MSIVGMDPNSVIPAASKLKNSGAQMFDAAQHASIDLWEPEGLPSNLLRQATELGRRANGCITSADAMATHSIDLSNRAAMFQQIEQDTGLDAATLTAANGGRPLWNHDTRHTAMHDPSGYWDEVDAGTVPAVAGRASGGKKVQNSGEPRSTKGKGVEVESIVPAGDGIHGAAFGDLPTVGSFPGRGAGAARGTEVPGRIDAVRGLTPKVVAEEPYEAEEPARQYTGADRVLTRAKVSAKVGLSGGAVALAGAPS